jgi:hypothetical protein
MILKEWDWDGIGHALMRAVADEGYAKKFYFSRQVMRALSKS